MAVGTAGVNNALPYGPGPGVNPALDALRRLGSLNSAGSGSTGSINPNRLTEADSWGNPPSATPPAQLSIPDHILGSLLMAGPLIRKGPIQNMAPERREKPAYPATEG